MNEKSSIFNCDKIKQWLFFQQEEAKNNPNKLTTLIIELIHQATTELTKTQINASTQNTILDIRTITCAIGNCDTSNRSHARLTTYNMNKITNYHTHISTKLKNIVKEITNLWKLNKTNELYLQSKQSDKKFICFVKETNDTVKTKTEAIPIEELFSFIDGIAEENSEIIKRTKIQNPPGQKIENPNCYRMSYGDLNYLGNNKAIFYFDRGIRGLQTYTNSMYSEKRQPPSKDIVVIDDIVFTSNCKCDSFKQHLKMFPHYRVTIAPGLTCPARLTTMERILFARNKNASTQTFVTARAMLIRYW